jgi:hypothetical protein
MILVQEQKLGKIGKIDLAATLLIVIVMMLLLDLMVSLMMIELMIDGE